MRHLIVISMLFFCFAKPAFSQSYENIVFEGAGIRGLAYAGVVDELDQRKLRTQFKRVGGTSAGAITALLFALGYTGEEMEYIINNTNYRKFNDGKWFFVGGINRMNKRYGWYKGDAFSAYIGRLIKAKTGSANSTFQELKDAGYPEVYITGTCLNRQELTVFSYHNYPDMRVRDALRISMSIPMYFEAVFLDSTGTIVRHPTHPERYDVFVDGGITGNFPIWIFDSFNESTGEVISNSATLGIRIDTDNQIKEDSGSRALVHQEITSFSTYISSLYIFINENLNRPPISETHWQHTISVSSVGIGPRIKKLSLEEKHMLVNSGRRSTSAFLDR